MLKSLVTPMLVMLWIGSSSFYYISSQATKPAQLGSVAQQATPTAPGQAPLPTQPTTPSLPPTKLPDVDAMLVIDNSGSMFGYTCRGGEKVTANDENKIRIRGAEIIIGALAADLKPRETKLGIVTFGDGAELVRPLTQLSNDDPSIRSDLSAAIRNPPCQGDTNIVAALREAQSELNRNATPGNIPAIIFLTDGEPTLGGGTPEIEILLDELDSVNVLFFAVLLGSDPKLKEFKEFWSEESQRRPNVTFYPIGSSEEIPALYKQITAKLNVIPGLATTPSLPPGQRVEVPVPANVQQMVLTITKRAPDVPLQIQYNSGQDARALPPDRFRSLIDNSPIEVFVVERPEAGTWVVSAPDGESVTVLQPEFKSVYQVQLLQTNLQSLLSVDQPTELVVQIIDSGTQMPLTGDFTVTGSYRQQQQPESDAAPLMFQPGSVAPQYTVQIPAGTFVEGQEYIFSLTVEDSAGLRSQPSIYPLLAGRMPMLVSLVAAPARAYVDQPITLIAKVVNQDSASGQPTLQLMQQLPGGVAPIFTTSDSATYQATLPAFGLPGNYTLGVTYAGKTITGHDFRSTQQVPIVVEERALTLWLRRIALAVAILSGAYLIFRFLLLGSLIPLFQRVGISPQGYVRIIPPGQTFPNGEDNLRDLLRRRRKLRKLTLGVGSGFDIPLEAPPTPPDDEEEEAPKARPGLRERLWGKRPAGYVRKRAGATLIESGGQFAHV